MRYILENDILRAEIDSFGAELKSVKRKSDEKEYMWYGDKKYWEEPPRYCSLSWEAVTARSIAMTERLIRSDSTGLQGIWNLR